MDNNLDFNLYAVPTTCCVVVILERRVRRQTG